MKKWLKRFGWSLLLAILVLVAVNFDLLLYGLGQAKGQFKVIWQAKSIEETLADAEFPDSLKQNLHLVEEVKRFAIDSLGLKPTDNYSTVYNQKGQDILWVVSACEPYEFTPRRWSFPIIGSFSYKGFFDLDKAKQLASELKAEGLDIYVRPVSGWSTLGWFKDPILSNMLAETQGELANTIIHELTHGTIFIPDSMTFNENLATFIGNKGAEDFLKFKYGLESAEYSTYVSAREDSRKFTRYVVRQAAALDSLYNSLLTTSELERQRKKEKFINDFVEGLVDIDFANRQRYRHLYTDFKPNNAFFISFLDYRERQDEFDSLYLEDHQGNLADFINSWKSLYSN